MCHCVKKADLSSSLNNVWSSRTPAPAFSRWLAVGWPEDGSPRLVLWGGFPPPVRSAAPFSLSYVRKCRN